MPKIKAYKADGAIIPVDVAKLSTAYRCPWTKKVYATKPAYVKHLRALRDTRIRAKIRHKIYLNKCQELWNQPDLDSIINWINNNPEFMFENACRHRWGVRDEFAHIRDEFWVKITYLDLTYSNSVSNSHDCPRGGVRNWGGRETYGDGTPKPRGYPGFSGRIEYRMSHDIGFGSEVMEGLGIHTGSGGGISRNRIGCGVSIFLEDWPGLEMARTMDLLKDEGNKGFKYGKPEYFR